MIKRIISIIIILAVCLGLAACSCTGCGSTSEPAANNSSQQAASGADGESDDNTQSSTTDTDGNAEGTQQADSAEDAPTAQSGSNSDSDTNDDENSTADATQTGTGGAQSGFAITKQPKSTGVAVGTPVTLSVAASGTGAFSYQWYASLTNGYNGVAMTNKTDSTAALQTDKPYVQYYYCVITQKSTGKTITSSIATVSVTGTAQTPVPTPTPPSTSAPIWVKGVHITQLNYTDVLGDGSNSVQFDTATNTLTLNGATISHDGTGAKTAAIHSDMAGLTINLIGDSTVENTGASATNARGYSAIEITNTLTVKGTGTLTATGGEGTGTGGNGGKGGSGIYASGNGAITMQSGTLKAIGADSNEEEQPAGDAIVMDGGAITIVGGALHATGGSGGERNSDGGDGIKTRGAITILDGALTTTGGNVHYRAEGGDGIDTTAALTIENGTLTATGGNGKDEADGHGIKSDSAKITIKGGTVTAISGNNEGDGNGIDASNTTISISGGKVEATSQKSGNGICVLRGGLEILGSAIVTATGGEGSINDRAGIYTFYIPMTISGNAKVIAKGGEGGTNGGSGIRVDGAGGVLTIKDNATVEADGATSGTFCGNGISSYVKTEILGSANVTARGGSGAGSGGYGLVSYTSEDINIGTATEPFSGTLTAIGGKTTGALRKDGTAFRNDAKATSFLNTMHYYTYNGTDWMDIGTGATSLPTGHYNNLGIGLGMTLPTVKHIPTP